MWTLKFNEDDANAKLKDISFPYIERVKIRTQEEVDRDVKYIKKYRILI